MAALLDVRHACLGENMLVQVGLATKNAILIIEFARMAEVAGMSRREPAAAARTRLRRPILMTGLASVLGAPPLKAAPGAGAEMGQSLGVTLFTPVLYAAARRAEGPGRKARPGFDRHAAARASLRRPPRWRIPGPPLGLARRTGGREAARFEIACPSPRPGARTSA